MRHRQEDVILGYATDKDSMTFWDSRFGELRSIQLGAFEAAVYMASDVQPVTVSSIAEKLECSVREVELAIDCLNDQRLIWRESNEVFGLGIDIRVVEEHIASQWKKHWTSLYS